jgi:hypothetical protein
VAVITITPIFESRPVLDVLFGAGRDVMHEKALRDSVDSIMRENIANCITRKSVPYAYVLYAVRTLLSHVKPASSKKREAHQNYE